jgi:peptide/nickel transport system substrate-binding protein
MEEINRRRFIAMLGAAGAGLVASCSSSDSGEVDAAVTDPPGSVESTTASADTTAPPTESSAATPAVTEPAAPIGPSGTLRLGSPWPFTTFNAHDVIRAGVGGMAYWRVQFDSLIDRAEDGTLLPALATEWDLTPEGFTLALREGVTFSDGTPFDADVVKANLEDAAKDPRLGPLFGGITYEVLSPTSLAGTLPRPNPTFLHELVNNGGLMMAPGTLRQPSADTDPIGTGPWVYQKAESTPGQVYVFTLREDYWRPEIQGVERVEVYELPDIGARGNALRSNQIDLTAFNDPSQIEIAEAGFELLSIPSDVQAFLVIDREGTKVPALGKPEVRRALSLAINREALADQLLNGAAVALTQLRAPGHPEYDESLSGLVSYDLDEAKSLMAAAGFADGFDLTLPFNPGWRVTYEAVQAMWGELGVNVELVPLSPEEFGPRNTSGEFPIAFLPAPGPDIANSASFFFGPAPVNPLKAVDADVVPLVMAANSTFGDERTGALVDLQRLLLEQAYMIPVVAGTKSAAHATNVTGVAWTFEDLVPAAYGVRVG